MPSLVILAAGSGSRFGGLKQLAEIDANGAAIMDILVRRAAGAGFERAVIVVSPGTEALVRAHLDDMRRSSAAVDLSVELAVQHAVPGRSKPLGTAAAALAARDLIDGSFAVVNADDLYPPDAFAALAKHVRLGPPDEHAMVAFRVDRTLTGTRPVSRAIVEIDDASGLVAIHEGTVVRAPDGLRFESAESSVAIDGSRRVSMNMWGFRVSVFDALADAVAEFVAGSRDGEVYLPDVVASMVGAGVTVRVLLSESECPGVTYEDDVERLRRSRP